MLCDVYYLRCRKSIKYLEKLLVLKVNKYIRVVSVLDNSYKVILLPPGVDFCVVYDVLVAEGISGEFSNIPMYDIKYVNKDNFEDSMDGKLFLGKNVSRRTVRSCVNKSKDNIKQVEI